MLSYAGPRFLKKNDHNSEFQLPATSGFVPGCGISLPETGSVAPLPASFSAPPEVPPGSTKNILSYLTMAKQGKGQGVTRWPFTNRGGQEFA